MRMRERERERGRVRMRMRERKAVWHTVFVCEREIVNDKRECWREKEKECVRERVCVRECA